MTSTVNLTLTCYYFEIAPGYVLSTKMAEGGMTSPVNLTLTCYYFEITPGYVLSTKMAEG